MKVRPADGVRPRTELSLSGFTPYLRSLTIHIELDPMDTILKDINS